MDENNTDNAMPQEGTTPEAQPEAMPQQEEAKPEGEAAPAEGGEQPAA